MNIKRIDHINVVVSNLKEAKEFFLAFGFTIIKQDTLEGEWIDKITNLKDVKAEYVALSIPGQATNLELVQYISPNGSLDPNMSKPNQLGFRHLAFAVDDLEGLVKELKVKNITFLSDIQSYGTGKKLCYFLGPEGIILELAEYS